MSIINIQLYNFDQMEWHCSALQEDAKMPMSLRASISMEALVLKEQEKIVKQQMMRIPREADTCIIKVCWKQILEIHFFSATMPSFYMS